MKSREIMALEESLGHHFQRRELIEQALTHSSQAREVEALGAGSGSSGGGDNEMLEFLGDAVLGLVTSEALFRRFPEFQEGHLSKLRAHLVGQRHLLRVAEQLQIGHYMRLGRGEEKSGGRNKASLLVDALEAILAALAPASSAFANRRAPGAPERAAFTSKRKPGRCFIGPLISKDEETSSRERPPVSPN